MRHQTPTLQEDNLQPFGMKKNGHSFIGYSSCKSPGTALGDWIQLSAHLSASR